MAEIKPLKITPEGDLAQFSSQDVVPVEFGGTGRSTIEGIRDLIIPFEADAAGEVLSKDALGNLLWADITGYTGSVGLTGSVGYTGSQGVQGVQGYTGSAGTQGELGYTGSQGAQGAQGVQGFTGSQGDAGYTGSTGVTGFTGSAGIQGVQGIIGFTGSQGDAGTTGFTGSQGVQGVIGYTGSMGDIGATGFTGSQGATGFTGSVGMGFTIAKTYDSVADLTADTTPSGIIAGQFAIINTGDVSDPEDARLYLWDGSSYQFIVDMSGTAGVQGATGATGYTGSAGATGATGFTGSSGVQGIIGYTGSQGDTGAVGFTGSQGIQGIIGYTGSQGSTGFTGSIGDAGYTGSQGLLGYTGSQGNIGFTGSQGVQGDTGFTGSQGYTGSIGYTGSTGYTGSQGAIGYTGSAGGVTDGDKGDIVVSSSGSQWTVESVAGNLHFNGSGARITGDFSNATVANRLMFQTSTPNASTILGAIPSGTGQVSALLLYTSSSGGSAALGLRGGSDAGDARIMAGTDSTGTTPYPLTFYTAGVERMRIDTIGNVGIGETPASQYKFQSANGNWCIHSDVGQLFIESSGRVNRWWITANISDTVDDGVYIGKGGNGIATGTKTLKILNDTTHINPNGGLGYGPGAGGQVTQATSKSTAVTLNKPCGQITMNNAALAAGASVLFTLSNSVILFNDILLMGTTVGGNYRVDCVDVFNGGATIRVANISGVSLSDALVVRFAIIKGVTS